MKMREIGEFIGNITTLQVSYLCNKGYKVMKCEEKYSNIMGNFIKEFSSY